MQQVETAFSHIMRSDIFRTDGEPIDLVESLQALADAVNDADECDWGLVKGLECTLADLIVAAYWIMTEWHDGKDGYRLLCSLGSIFTPGMTDGPEPDSCEFDAYTLLNQAMEKECANK